MTSLKLLFFKKNHAVKLSIPRTFASAVSASMKNELNQEHNITPFNSTMFDITIKDKHKKKHLKVFLSYLLAILCAPVFYSSMLKFVKKGESFQALFPNANY